MLESYNLNIILKVTTKTAVKYTQGEMRKELKHFTTENQLNSTMTDKSLLINNNLNVSELNFPIKR